MVARIPALSRMALGGLLVCAAGYTPLVAAQTPPTFSQQGTLPLQDSVLPTRGVLVISAASQATVSVLVDGRPFGVLPQRIELEPGMHDIAGLAADLEFYPIRVHVDAGQTVSVTLTAVPRLAWFEIDPGASDAQLFVDGKLFGAGKQTLSLSPGHHELELRRTGYKSQRLDLAAAAGQRAKLTAAAYIPVPASPAAATSAREVQPTLPPEPSHQPQSQALPPKTDSSPYTGIYGSLIVPIMLGSKATHSYLTDCPATPFGGACTASAPRGGGLALRMGFFYEWLGIELVGAGAVDVSTSELRLPPIATISSAMQDAAGRSVFVRGGGMYGIGARLAIPMQGLRLTVGADYLFIHRKVYAIPDSFTGASLSYTTPGWFIDGGIQLGSTPGARFYLGAFAMIEQAHTLPLTRDLRALGLDPSLVPEALTHMQVYQGRQIFYGPLLGIAFGH